MRRQLEGMRLDRKPTSHDLLLAWAMLRTPDDVLEVGGGPGSTPFLHALCAGNRRLVTLDNNTDWFNHLKHFQSATHDVRLVRNWLKCDLFDKPWGVALVDCAPAHLRPVIVARLVKRTRFVIVHDFNKEKGRDYSVYKWDTLPRCLYVYLDKTTSPRTLIMSNFAPVDVSLPLNRL